MKSLSEFISEGISYSKDEFIFNFEHDNEVDIIKLQPKKLERVNFYKNTFCFNINSHENHQII